MHNHCPAPSTGLSPITSQKGGAGAKVHQLGLLAGRGQARLGSRRSKHFPAQNAKIPGKTGSDFSEIHVVEKVAFCQTLVLGARPTKTCTARPGQLWGGQARPGQARARPGKLELTPATLARDGGKVSLHNRSPGPSTGISPITSQQGGAGAKVHQ